MAARSQVRGRPPLLMTQRRKQVFMAIVDDMASGRSYTYAGIARRCGMSDYRDARRIVQDLKKMGMI